MSEQPEQSEQPEASNHPFGFGQAVKVHAEAVVIRNGKPVEDDTAPTTVQED